MKKLIENLCLRFTPSKYFNFKKRNQFCFRTSETPTNINLDKIATFIDPQKFISTASDINAPYLRSKIK